MDKVISLLRDFFNTLSQNDILNFVFLILAILSILISIILYVKSKKEKEPVYLLRSFNLFKGNKKSLKDLSIDYKGEKVEKLTITNVSFWNKGKMTINKNDIVEKDRLRINFPKEIKILGADIVFEKNSINGFTTYVENETNSVFFDFDYIDKNQGMKFRIYHDGLPSDEISIEGSIKGVNKIKNGEHTSEFYADKLFDNTIGLPRKIMNNTVWKLYVILFIPIVIVIFFIGSISSGLRNIFNRIPSEFVPKFDSINEN
ncbi:hypothetical protein GCM10007962_28380 [Yeosuana aromativorans]|uniref:Uncharacterized protein n=1 Tax=Yeosuana aromativorans TaxID=288019 RepID=A0A8J3FI76_9FLAO|nr:hypothetical protein [Yeosuana aromativorans]GGK32346.1 hypothetical protein GCM10007962_28380 [Yeosuana aromativorans]